MKLSRWLLNPFLDILEWLSVQLSGVDNLRRHAEAELHFANAMRNYNEEWLILVSSKRRLFGLYFNVEAVRRDIRVEVIRSRFTLRTMTFSADLDNMLREVIYSIRTYVEPLDIHCPETCVMCRRERNDDLEL